MIDWLKFEVPLLHKPLYQGQILCIDSEGNEEWSQDKRIRIRGSFEESALVKSLYETPEDRKDRRYATYLLIDVNPSKFLQYHNVDGSENLLKLAELTYLKICNFYPRLRSEMTLQSIRNGLFEVHRLDINRMFDLGCDTNVEQWLHAAEFHARSRHGRATSSKGTVYIGKGSSLFSICFYNKYREITKGGLKHNIKENPAYDKDELIEYARGKLRCELRLLKKQIERLNLLQANDIKNEIENLFKEFIGRVEMKSNIKLIDEDLFELPNATIGVYQLWKQGYNVQEMYSKSRFYHHRKILLDFNIDIAMKPVTKESNVIPLLRVLEAKPAIRPQHINKYVIQ